LICLELGGESDKVTKENFREKEKPQGGRKAEFSDGQAAQRRGEKSASPGVPKGGPFQEERPWKVGKGQPSLKIPRKRNIS